MSDQAKWDTIATQRFQWVAPLLAEGLDAAQIRVRREEICAQTGLSERTVRRYVAQYRAQGFAGLQPRPKASRRSKDAVPEALVQEAILLRREVPRRSVSQIIQILEWEGRAMPGQIKRSTLQERLMSSGYSARQMRLYTANSGAARRFQKHSRNALWQSDIKFGPYLPLGPHGEPKQVYLVVFIDDATRFVVAGAFYPTLDQVTVEDSFHQGIQAYGRPDAVYFDNGQQYRSHQMNRICAKVGTRLLFARPYSPESKGKIEKFNQMVDDFLAEVAVAHPATLERLNTLFSVWLMECYQTQPHSALPDGQTPTQAYQQDPQPPHWVDPDLLAQAFLHAERRKVDKAGCISFQGRKYEVGLPWIGKKVDVVYDPHDTETVTIEYDGQNPWAAHPLVIGEWAGHRPALPDTLQPQPVAGSRLLDAAEQRHRARALPPVPAVVYRTPPPSEEDAHGDH